MYDNDNNIAEITIPFSVILSSHESYVPFINLDNTPSTKISEFRIIKIINKSVAIFIFRSS